MLLKFNYFFISYLLLPGLSVLILDEGVLNLARMYRRDLLVFDDEADITKANCHADWGYYFNHSHQETKEHVFLQQPTLSFFCCRWAVSVSCWLVRQSDPEDYHGNRKKDIAWRKKIMSLTGCFLVPDGYHDRVKKDTE